MPPRSGTAWRCPWARRAASGRRVGYRSAREWHAKSRRLAVLEDRLERERADREAGIVHVVREGKRLARTRHHLTEAELTEAELTEAEWRQRWEAERWFLQPGV